uniref:Uncharacterized protein n=1 Tax=Parascaris equorum TaxID=6256 RepID=A0A914RT41_PAREQ
MVEWADGVVDMAMVIDLDMVVCGVVDTDLDGEVDTVADGAPMDV